MAKDRPEITINVSKDTCEAYREKNELAVKNVGDKVYVMSQNLGKKIEDLGEHIRGNGKVGALEKIRNIKDDIKEIKEEQNKNGKKLDGLVTLRDKIEISCKVIKYVLIIAFVVGVLWAGGEVFNIKLFDKNKEVEKHIVVETEVDRPDNHLRIKELEKRLEAIERIDDEPSPIIIAE
jgi:hypothetical protein